MLEYTYGSTGSGGMDSWTWGGEGDVGRVDGQTHETGGLDGDMTSWLATYLQYLICLWQLFCCLPFCYITVLSFYLPLYCQYIWLIFLLFSIALLPNVDLGVLDTRPPIISNALCLHLLQFSILNQPSFNEPVHQYFGFPSNCLTDYQNHLCYQFLRYASVVHSLNVSSPLQSFNIPSSLKRSYTSISLLYLSLYLFSFICPNNLLLSPKLLICLLRMIFRKM